MEIFDECTICGKWDDLIRWTKSVTSKSEGGQIRIHQVTIAYACTDCYNKLVSHKGRGWTKEKIVEAVIKEVSNGKK